MNYYLFLLVCFSSWVAANDLALEGDISDYVLASNGSTIVKVNRDGVESNIYSDGKWQIVTAVGTNYDIDESLNVLASVSPNSKYVAFRYNSGEFERSIRVIDIKTLSLILEEDIRDFLWLTDSRLALFLNSEADYPFFNYKGILVIDLQDNSKKIQFPEYIFTGSYVGANDYFLAETYDYSNPDLLYKIENKLLKWQ